ncbi:MAG: selenide, water dikinase SelD [Persicimonas sp.]
MKQDVAIQRDLVLVGGGHSHVAALKMFGMEPVPGLRLTLVTRDVHTPYSGMLPGLISGRYDFDEAHIDLRPLCRFAGARLFHATVDGVDLDRQVLSCQGRPPVAFDLVSFDIGSTPDTRSVPGAAEHTTPVKPIDGFLERFDRLTDELREGRRDRLRLAVVGGGAGGVELILSIEYRLRRLLARTSRPELPLEVALYSASEHLIPDKSRRVSDKFERILAERGIDLFTDCAIARVEADGVIDEAGEHHDFDEVIWVTQASAPRWIEQTGLATDDRGFIQVDEYLRSTSHPEVFAAGDIASMQDRDLAKSGVYAVRQGKPLAKNLRRAAKGQPLTAYRPQKNFLSLIGTGDDYAVGARGWLSFEGEWVWRLKEWIDRRWMRQWVELPQMDEQVASGQALLARENDESEGKPARYEPIGAISQVAMRCGGCGSKLGTDVLSRVLSRLDPGHRDDILLGLDAPDDAAMVEVPEGKRLVQTVDFFRTFIDDPYTFGRVAAVHSLGDVWAMGAAAQAALAVAAVPFADEEKVEEDLYQLMSGAIEVLRESGAVLTGGHSAEGAEMAFGLQVNGLVDPEHILRKSGMQPGQALVLTKALGTGTLFAADMRQKAKGRWISAALASMTTSSQRAAECLVAHGATACTDVTGFGLLGHLVEMTRASGVDATIEIDRLPILEGALQTVGGGILSSLYPDNVRLRRAIRNQPEARHHASYPLLFDPQTAGGLMASIPADRAEACITNLHELGYPDACIIGRIEAKTDELAPIVVQ